MHLPHHLFELSKHLVIMENSSLLPLKETPSSLQTNSSLLSHSDSLESPPYFNYSSHSDTSEPPSYFSDNISASSSMMNFSAERSISFTDVIIYVNNAGWPLFLAMIVNTGIAFYYLLPINESFYLDELIFKMTFSHLPLLTHLVLSSIRTTFDSAWFTTREQNAIMWIFLLLQWLMQWILWMTMIWNREYARKFLYPQCEMNPN